MTRAVSQMARQLQKHPEQSSTEQGRIPSMIPQLVKTPLLVQDEELDLARRARDGDETARRKLVEANMRLVCNMAKNYHTHAIPFEDLVQEGAIGLMRAIDRFDPERGWRFSTYAVFWIRQAIGKAMLDRSRVIRLPAHFVDERKRANKVREAFTAKHGRTPSPEELARDMGITLEKMTALDCSEHDCVSLESGKDEVWDYTAVIADSNCEDPEHMAFKKVDHEEFLNLIEKLPERERNVIKQRLGYAGDGKAQALIDVAQSLGVSREMVRQIESRAIRSLRRMLLEPAPEPHVTRRR